jgi:hypothetical protein
MAGKQAKVLSKDDVNDLLAFARCTRNPVRNEVIVLLSAKAGLRAGEIANLTWDMVSVMAFASSEPFRIAETRRARIASGAQICRKLQGVDFGSFGRGHRSSASTCIR